MTTLKFCRDCNNILHPKEDRTNKTLLYACRWCDYQEPAENNFVYHLEIEQTAESSMHLVQDVKSQPALPKTKSIRCKQCRHVETGFFNYKSPGKESALYFVCCECGDTWSPA